MDCNLIKRFYLNGFKVEDLSEWPRIWNKHFRARLPERSFIKLNNIRPRLNFKTLKKLCINIAPQHDYMSALNWLMPERVGPRCGSERAYPIGGEYVADIDISPLWRLWGGVERFSNHGFQIAKEMTVVLRARELAVALNGVYCSFIDHSLVKRHM